jgi:hypothetical protein
MFAENKQELVDASFLRDKKTGLYIMVKDATANPMPDSFEVIRNVQNVPRYVVSLLSSARTMEEHLRLLLDEGKEGKNYLDRVYGCQDVAAEIIESSKKK